MKSANLAEKLSRVTSHRDPHNIPGYNDEDAMVSRIQGTCPFHLHPTADDSRLMFNGERHTVRKAELFVVSNGDSNTGDATTAAPKPCI